MSRVLLLGGYGGFGGRIARRMADAGHDVLVAGRSLAKAEAFCAGRPRLKPIAVDRAAITDAIETCRPDLLVDASGPFQAMDYSIPTACIAAGISYLDIADSRAFVTGISTLDDAARRAGVVVISGASSVPALSGAVVRRLAEGMDRVRAVEIAISASNRATAGAAVAAAILGQVGKKMRIRRGGRWTEAIGWQDSETIDFVVPGVVPIRGRGVALVDVPDLDLLPGRLPGEPAVAFRAGTELGFQNRLLLLASRAVRSGLVHSLAPLAPWLRPLQELTRRWGSDRSAMIVRLFGDAANSKIERRWTLIADDGDGPEIPTLSILPIATNILAGRETAGARDAGLSLNLDDYTPAFATLAIRQSIEEYKAPPTLYKRVMGDRFAALPPEVRAMHDVWRDGGASGAVEVAAAANPITGLIARVIGFPPPGAHALHVSFTEKDGRETWTRESGGRRFHSHLSERGGRLIERFGPIRFAFDLPSDAQGLAMVMRRWWIGPVPLPLWLAPRSEAREWVEDGRFHFDVPIALPLLGRVTHYRGWLDVPEGS